MRKHFVRLCLSDDVGKRSNSLPIFLFSIRIQIPGLCVSDTSAFKYFLYDVFYQLFATQNTNNHISVTLLRYWNQDQNTL